MESSFLPFFLFFFFLSYFLLFTIISSGVHNIEKAESDQYHHNKTLKLFAFGDSYLDTGNFNKKGGSWVEPYGITFPHKPSGRFSDGRVFTDYIASFIGIKTPIPYRWTKYANETQLQRGINFAYGGSGVFETWSSDIPKLEIQINRLNELLLDQIYTKQDMPYSVALISSSGNDYLFYFKKNGTLQDISIFTRKLVKQLVKNLKQIEELGIPKILIAGIGPAGCYPQQTASSSYKICNEKYNSASKFHNHVLKEALKKLNYKNSKSTFVYLDFYNAFISSIKQYKDNTGNMKCENPLRPCCEGLSSKNACGQVDDIGNKMYVVCKHPELSFFWDSVHPSQNGWNLIYLALRHTLTRLF